MPSHWASSHRRFPNIKPTIFHAVFRIFIITKTVTCFIVEIFGHPFLLTNLHCFINLSITRVCHGSYGSMLRKYFFDIQHRIRRDRGNNSVRGDGNTFSLNIILHATDREQRIFSRIEKFSSRIGTTYFHVYRLIFIIASCTPKIGIRRSRKKSTKKFPATFS